LQLNKRVLQYLYLIQQPFLYRQGWRRMRLAAQLETVFAMGSSPYLLLRLSFPAAQNPILQSCFAEPEVKNKHIVPLLPLAFLSPKNSWPAPKRLNWVLFGPDLQY